MALRNYFQSVDWVQEMIDMPFDQLKTDELIIEGGCCIEFKFRDLEENSHCSICPLYPQDCAHSLEECIISDNTLAKMAKAIEAKNPSEFYTLANLLLKQVQSIKHLFELDEYPSQYNLEHSNLSEQSIKKLKQA